MDLLFVAAGSQKLTSTGLGSSLQLETTQGGCQKFAACQKCAGDVTGCQKLVNLVVSVALFRNYGRSVSKAMLAALADERACLVCYTCYLEEFLEPSLS